MTRGRAGVWGSAIYKVCWMLAFAGLAACGSEHGGGGESLPAMLLSDGPTLLAPVSMSVKRGSVSNQPVSVLGKKEQTGTADDWNTYVEFSPASSGASVVFNYSVPSSFPLTSLSGLGIDINYRGQKSSAQEWTFALYDHLQGQWVTAGNNAFAGDWTWSAASLSGSGKLTRFVNANRKVFLRYMTTSAVDASALDYLVVRMQSGTAPSPSPSPSPTPSPPPAAWWKPVSGLSWQMQYSGTIDTSLNVNVYMLDMFGTDASVISSLKARSVKVVCYIDGGSWESYTPDAAQFPAVVLGKGVGGWPDERFVDIRSRDLLWPIMRARMDLAKQKGCDGIYHDWADSYLEDTGFPLTSADQLTYNRFWIAESHARGLSVGLINDLLQVADLADEYDWGLNESCMVYGQCSYLKPFIDAGKPVFALQYSGDPAVYCPKLNALNFDGLFKKVALDAYRLPCR